LPAPRFTTLLLDLDGTLLDVEMQSFLEAFFPLAAARFGGPGEARRISQALAAAAREMLTASDGARTVDLLFLESFAPAVGRTPDQVRATLSAFYRAEFERMRRLVRPIPGARAFVERALGLGCELVLATNPVFFLEAIGARVRWAGLADVPFALVTGAELMHWTKPHPGYYRQILQLTGRRAGQCLMAGDDPRMDMAAKQAGIATWLVEHDGEARRPAPLADRRGTLAQLADWLEAGS
jgi:FMN phosphatase YigB (HAD superfamily)